MIIQLRPTVPLETPHGKGQAHFLIDYGRDHDLVWVVFIDETAECWTFQNPDIRIQHNYTMGRPKPIKPYKWSEQWTRQSKKD